MIKKDLFVMYFDSCFYSCVEDGEIKNKQVEIPPLQSTRKIKKKNIENHLKAIKAMKQLHYPILIVKFHIDKITYSMEEQEFFSNATILETRTEEVVE